MAADLILMIKPVGSTCQMACRYCYYLDTKGALVPGARMEEEVLSEVIRQYVEAAQGPVVSFTWHGGEPTLAGLDFFRRAVALEKEYLPPGWKAWNSLQTNGLLIDEEWASFLAENHFDVGLSVDGSRACHDENRRTAGGEETWERVMAAAELLKRHGIKPDLLCTVNSSTVRHAREVYRALRDLDTGWMQFIPVVTEGEKAPYGISSEEYGAFLREVFFEWYYHDLGRTQVQLFSEMSLVLAGGSASLCTMGRECGHALVVERDGGVYACDHFVREPFYLGNVTKESLASLAGSEKLKAFGKRKSSEVSGDCGDCPYWNLCCGGCIKDRRPEDHRYVLCAGLREFFAYAVPRLQAAMKASARGKSPEQIMEEAVFQERMRYANVSRNDACPCGSGKKFKNCCARMVP